MSEVELIRLAINHLNIFLFHILVLYIEICNMICTPATLTSTTLIFQIFHLNASFKTVALTPIILTSVTLTAI